MPETKHAFIDDYPFIQYTDVADSIPSGSNIEVEALTATENKTYTAPEGKAYSPVTVNVAGEKHSIEVGDGVEHGTIIFYAFTEDFDPEVDEPITGAYAGEWVATLSVPDEGYIYTDGTTIINDGTEDYHGNFPTNQIEELGASFVMPAADVSAYATFTEE